MQVDGGEQCDFVCAGRNLLVSPCKVFLDLRLEVLQCLQVFFMNTMLGEFCSIACDKFMILVICLIKRLFGPVFDQTQLIQSVDAFNDLVVGVAVKSDTGCGIRICRIPYQVRHDRLVLTAGNECISADLCVLFNDAYGIAVLCSLCSCGHTCSAGTDNDNVKGFINRRIRCMGDLVLLESVRIGNGSLFRRICDCILERKRCKCSTGYDINAASVCLDDFRNQNIIRNGSDMVCLHRLRNLNRSDCAVAECDIDLDRSVITVAGSAVCACLKGQCSIFCRRSCFAASKCRDINTCGLQGSLCGVDDCLRGNRRTGYRVNRKRLCLNDCARYCLNCRI